MSKNDIPPMHFPSTAVDAACNCKERPCPLDGLHFAPVPSIFAASASDSDSDADRRYQSSAEPPGHAMCYTYPPNLVALARRSAGTVSQSKYNAFSACPIQKDDRK